MKWFTCKMGGCWEGRLFHFKKKPNLLHSSTGKALKQHHCLIKLKQSEYGEKKIFTLHLEIINFKESERYRQVVPRICMLKLFCLQIKIHLISFNATANPFEAQRQQRSSAKGG